MTKHAGGCLRAGGIWRGGGLVHWFNHLLDEVDFIF